MVAIGRLTSLLTTLAVWIAPCFLFSCSESDPETPTEDQLNVLLVTLDTTRADRIGCYGYEAALTPAMDSVAKAGVRFDSAYCQVPLTLPSHASLLTGTYPAVNGIRVNGGGVLGDETPTLARVFRERGYRTGAFTSIMVLHSYFGLDQGFDVYDNPVGDAQLRSSTRTRSVRPGGETCDNALEWLRKPSTKPFFAWVHFFDPHLPLNPPPPFDTRLEDPYDGEIAYADAQIGRLLAWLDESGKRERTLIVITADHGEALGDHGEDEHGLFLYSSTTRVPLILAAPGRLPENKVVDGPVGLVSLMPTILEFMNWGVDFEMNGNSFADAWNAPEWTAEASYCETEYPRLGYGWSAIQSMVTDEWLYVDSPQPELFDRRSDRNESTNVIDQHADVAKRLERELAALKATMEPRVAPDANLSAEDRAALEALGYVQTSSDRDAPDEGRDPKEMVAVSNDYLRALSLLRTGAQQEALDILERLVVASPESDAIHGTLANIYAKRGQHEEAVREYQLSLRTNPNDAGRLSSLGNALLQLNDIEGATIAFKQALKLDPDFGQAHSRMGMLEAKAGNFPRAQFHFEEFVRVDPQSTSALCNLANLHVQNRKFGPATELLKRAIAVDPECIPAHHTLWRATRTGAITREQVTGLLQQSLAKKPKNDELAARLAWAFATSKTASAEQKSEALTLASRRATAQPQDWFGQDALAAALAANGQFAEAVVAAQRALQFSRTKAPSAAAALEHRIQLYQQGKRYFE